LPPFLTSSAISNLILFYFLSIKENPNLLADSAKVSSYSFKQVYSISESMLSLNMETVFMIAIEVNSISIFEPSALDKAE
jgi:hypothetical protein